MPRRRPSAPKPVLAREAAPASASADRIESLTGLRGIAAVGVFAFHAWLLAHAPDTAPGAPAVSRVLDWLMRNGWAGVDVFFTLSAFLLSLPYARAAVAGAARPAAADYFRRRAARILPAYWVQLAILLGAGLAGFAWMNGPRWPGPVDALAHAVLWLNAWPRIEPMLSPWWTLPVEVGFYLLLPTLARAFAPKRWPWLLALVAFAWAWRAGWLLHPRADFSHMLWIDHLPGRIDQFAVGMLAALGWARLEARGATIAPARANAMLVAGAIAFVAMPALFLVDGRPVAQPAPSLHPLVLAWHGLASVPVAAILLACMAGAPLARYVLASRPVRALGHVSYSFYLWHLPVIAWVVHDGGDVARGEFWPFFAACLLMSLALATLSWWAIERPAMRWATRA
jgi:peptidoglycan/LPS O-acetylase OafA/YrhL